MRMHSALRHVLLFIHDFKMMEQRVIASPADAFILFADMAQEVRETLRAVWVDDRGGVLSVRTGPPGEVHSVPMPIPELIRNTVLLNASGLIVGHNHPDGRSEPSAEDIRATRRLADAAQAIGVRLLDHVVVTRAGCRSFRLDGLI